MIVASFVVTEADCWLEILTSKRKLLSANKDDKC